MTGRDTHSALLSCGTVLCLAFCMAVLETEMALLAFGDQEAG